MTFLLWALLPGALVACGIAVIASQFVPRTIKADDALARLGDLTPREPVSDRRTGARIGSWMSRHAPNVRGFTAPVKDLDLLDETVSGFYFAKLQYAAIGFLIPLLAPLLLLPFGIVFILPALASPVVAILMWTWPDSIVRSKAKERRREFTRFVTVYLELVAVSLLSSTTVDAALDDAASVSNSWVFERIRREYRLAALTRESKWDALERLGQQVQVPSLEEMSRMLRLADARVGMRQQLRAACDKLRAEVAADDKDAAAKRTGAIAIPVVLTLVPIMILGIAPSIAALLNS